MYKKYKHTQTGNLMLIVLCIVLAFIVFFMSFFGFNTIGFIVVLIVILALWMFTKLTVEIDSEFLRIKFGAGIIRKKFPINEIKSCREVKNHWYYGWGIRITPHGILYNVSGLFAVELEMKKGRKYRIGTDEPEKLVQAIQEAIGT
ncbi:MAG: hypothetical protein U9R23_06575 [Candidatus Cloacimonadota bacterium]|nr:hypothetical protein [Candidatus Cloacimonadota bacterium]